MALEFSGGFGPTRRGVAAPLTVAIEVVKNIEADNAEVARHCRRRCCSGIGCCKHWCFNRVEPVVKRRFVAGGRVDAPKVKDANQIGDGVAGANHSRRRVAQIGHGVGVIAQGAEIATIVENQQPARIFLCQRFRFRGIGREERGRLIGAAPRRPWRSQGHLTIAPQEIGLGDGHLVGDTDEHSFITFQVAIHSFG